ncbi:MAG: hypothetical protein LN414_00190, partial [Candidatus Thermoplasmatota archaeon]|nr:hypothetical protein [Candidatus Thermoplasmatota archaeon]
DPFPPREISYKLRVVTNLPPEVDEDMAKTYGSWPMLEDRVDEGILLTDLFFDPEGGPLTFRVVPGHNASRLNVTVTGADRLRLEPAENASGFVESVTVEAMDGRGMTIRFTIDVAVIAVNDAPGVGHPTAGPPPEVLEFDEDTTGGPWDLLFWFWDSDNAMSEMTFSFETDLYLNAEMDDLDRLLIETLVPDWNGRTSVTIRVWDPEGLGALILMPIVVRPVNDAPVVGNPTSGPPPEVLELDEDTTGGPWDLLFWFWDCDNAMSEMTFTFETDLYLNATMDDMDRLVIDPIVPDWNGRTNITIMVRDPEGLGALIRMSVVVRPVNDPPRRMGPDIEMLVKGKPHLTIDVGGSFEDVDGDDLTFVTDLDGGLSIVITGSKLLISDLGPFDGQDLVITVHASDPSEETAGPLSIKLSISDVPSPHTVSSSVVEYTMVRGRDRQFTDFEIIDPDELPREYDVLLVVGDQIGEFGVVFTENDMVWRAGIPPHWTPELGDEDGDEVVTLWVTDSWYNASLSWTVHLLSQNSPPEIIRLGPDSEGPYWEGDELTFTVEATDPDGDELLYFWSFDDRYIIMFEEGGASYTVTDLELGDGIIYLIVSDGFDETRSNQTYLVKRRPNDPRPFEWTFP